jgi:hypothetical protein
LPKGLELLTYTGKVIIFKQLHNFFKLILISVDDLETHPLDGGLLDFDELTVLLKRIKLIKVAFELNGLVKHLKELVHLAGVTDKAYVIHLLFEDIEVLNSLLLHLPQLGGDNATLLDTILRLDGNELVIEALQLLESDLSGLVPLDDLLASLLIRL